MEVVKEQRKAAQSIFTFRKKVVNVAIAFLMICYGAAIPEVDLLVRLDFYFYFNNENQKYRFIKSLSCLANLYFLTDCLDFREIYNHSVLE